MYLISVVVLSSEEVHSRDLNDHTAVAGTEIVKLAKTALLISMGRIQAENTTQLQT